jgi:hypothetical protein
VSELRCGNVEAFEAAVESMVQRPEEISLAGQQKADLGSAKQAGGSVGILGLIAVGIPVGIPIGIGIPPWVMVAPVVVMVAPVGVMVAPVGVMVSVVPMKSPVMASGVAAVSAR